MHHTSLHRRSYFHALLIAMVMGAVGAGCGEEESKLDTSSSINAVNDWAEWNTGVFGSKDGYRQGITNNNHTEPVTFINGYFSSEYIYGIELKWGRTAALYGQMNGLMPQPLDTAGDPVCEIKYCLADTGILTGLRFILTSGLQLTLGHMCGSENRVAINNLNNALTNLTTFQGIVGGEEILWGVKFSYTGPHI
jgi:hypothetical protein